MQEDSTEKIPDSQDGLLAILVGSGLLVFGRSLIDGNIGKPTPF
ncbi:hypothetical protein [Pseudanabaena sp. FACHB-1998]|nr:hypothetical protein [Pseudanabaena sp. FACHB-1998]